MLLNVVDATKKKNHLSEAHPATSRPGDAAAGSQAPRLRGPPGPPQGRWPSSRPDGLRKMEAAVGLEVGRAPEWPADSLVTRRRPPGRPGPSESESSSTWPRRHTVTGRDSPRRRRTITAVTVADRDLVRARAQPAGAGPRVGRDSVRVRQLDAGRGGQAASLRVSARATVSSLLSGGFRAPSCRREGCRRGGGPGPGPPPPPRGHVHGHESPPPGPAAAGAARHSGRRHSPPGPQSGS